MICDPCRFEADGQKRNPEHGPWHPTQGGHADCKGCTCQHKPVKAGQINGS